jgi:DNA repair protein RadC
MAEYTNKPLPITSWAEDDRPREKLLNKGSRSLSDAELIAILLGSGSREETAVTLAQRILLQFHQNLNELGRASLVELMAFNGIGEAKGITILAALELGRRRQHNAARDLPAIRSSNDAFQILEPLVADLDHEQFWLILLNRGNKVLALEQISSGGITATIVDPKVVFRKALLAKATSIVLCHNHPSGTLKPSNADIELTRKLRRAGDQLEIGVVDHLIISNRGYYSFMDEGMLG